MKTAKQIIDEEALKLFPETYTGSISECIVIAMERYAEQFKPKWINVKDYLPEQGIELLLLNVYGIITDAYFIGFDEKMEPLFVSSDVDESSMYYLNVTHWMPLPEPPKE